MELFNVYSLYPIEPVRGKGCYVYDAAGTEYLDLYGCLLYTSPSPRDA